MHGIAFIKKDIEALIEDFYRVTGIRTAFISYDQSLWIEYPREKSLFCSILRRNPELEEQCRLCDKKALDISCNSETLYIYECHAGLIEAISPIFHESKLLGYMMLGQALDRIPNTELWERISLKYSDYNIDFNELEQAFYKLKCFDGEVLRSAARIMDISAKFIHSSKMVKLKESQLIERIRTFIENNLSRNISINDLSNYLNLSISHISHIIKANFNKCLTEYLLDRRIEKAKELLEYSNFNVKDISLKVGIPEQNYFSRMFKKSTGISPTEFRTANKK